MKDITIIDDFLPHPYSLLEAAQDREYKTETAEGVTFHGISVAKEDSLVPQMIAARFPGTLPTFSLFRRSPEGQVEPNFIHSDCEMGDWTAILYLNEQPAEGDGTDFWIHNASRAIATAIPGELLEEGRTKEGWTLGSHVEARFNRLLIFPSQLFHSRAIFENYGQGDTARLTQVTFGRYA